MKRFGVIETRSQYLWPDLAIAMNPIAISIIFQKAHRLLLPVSGEIGTFIDRVAESDWLNRVMK
jgi:hypothetical protein